MAVEVTSFAIFLLIFCSFEHAVAVKVDKQGYVMFCPCMGRFGNQADHYLGALSFAHGLNRTLVLPAWIEYKSRNPRSVQVPFDHYFQVEPLKKYHRVITMEHFMSELSPSIWPEGRRTVFCYSPRMGPAKHDCNPKDGNPFGSFWDTYRVDFDKSEFYGPLVYDTHNQGTAQQWIKKYPAERFPVLAFTGAPASFPIVEQDVTLHRYLKWSDTIRSKVERFLHDNIPNGPWIGIHLRNGIDWKRTCQYIDGETGTPQLFASPQCLGYHSENGPVTKDLCFPSKKMILNQVYNLAKKLRAKALFVAADDDHMIASFEKHLKSLKIKVVQYLPSEPHIDLALLGQADHFIGNCVSTFTAFAKRERDVNGRPSSFWGFPEKKSNTVHDEM